eukprot:CAMPEP_0119573038 /NCGR_PEP_ID=MMETSP1352-20130426/44925_1 /TAXON_ID=265584 /ORGANISM="Stauroneis constricta, Strain CCMP1120" /LENGTH=619 /DNA_ID=CAMNT_0007622725 /DNA_START=42 /DNA_END=1898 /DNA_ORIENTATION=+
MSSHLVIDTTMEDERPERNGLRSRGNSSNNNHDGNNANDNGANESLGSETNVAAPTPTRTQAVFIRSKPEVQPMNWTSRIKIQMRGMFSSNETNQWRAELERQKKDDPEQGQDCNGDIINSNVNISSNSMLSNKSNSDDSESDSPMQFRLEATNHIPKTGWLKSLKAFLCCSYDSTSAGSLSIGNNPNQKLAIYLHWVFRVNFIFLFAVMCSIFFLLVTIFAGIIIAAGRMDNECVRIGGEEFGHTGAEMADAFGLSWTTFSTVGYGSSYPSLSHENKSPSNCLFITVICSLESFLGVLYSGFCGAILFGKVLRIQSHAQVMFSDPIVIRFGSGVILPDAASDSGSDCEDNGDDTDDDTLSADSSLSKKIPCPVLEFRVVNRLFAEVGGEIMDATLNVVANVDANDADPRIRDALDPLHRIHLGSKTGSSTSSSAYESHSEYTDSNRSWLSGDGLTPQQLISKLGPLGAMLPQKRDHQAIIEDPSARLVSKRIFSKMQMLIETGDHPFFKRVWLARHVLNETSPVLKPKIRRMIRRNGGYWPNHLKTHEHVRDCLQFNQILVSLNGVSNVSASDVYAQKIYDFVDINVGYQFVNILYRDADGSLKVDTDLINDVKEQNG